MVLNYIISVIWLFLPASFANMAPVFVKSLHILEYPLDHKKKIGKKRILGEHKTYRGIITGIIAAILITYIQIQIYPYTKSISLVDYTQINFFYFGLFQGIGALGGDAIKSFVKRRINIKPGKPWIPFDQIDWIIGTSLLMFIFLNIPYHNYITAIIILGLLHPIINYMGYVLRLKENKI